MHNELRLHKSISGHGCAPVIEVGAVLNLVHLPMQTFSKALATAKEQIARSLLK